MRFYTPIFNQFLQTQGQTIDEVIQKEQEATLSVDTTSFKPLRHSAKETEPRQPTVYQFSTDLLSIKAGNLLGEGCFGMVKKHLASTGEVIAVKSVCFFTKVDREDFEAEVEALRAMNRLKGFKIMDYPQPRCNAYKISYHSKGWIAMEFYNGPPLSDKVLYQ